MPETEFPELTTALTADAVIVVTVPPPPVALVAATIPSLQLDLLQGIART